MYTHSFIHSFMQLLGACCTLVTLLRGEGTALNSIHRNPCPGGVCIPVNMCTYVHLCMHGPQLSLQWPIACWEQGLSLGKGELGNKGVCFSSL